MHATDQFALIVVAPGDVAELIPMELTCPCHRTIVAVGKQRDGCDRGLAERTVIAFLFSEKQ